MSQCKIGLQVVWSYEGEFGFRWTRPVSVMRSGNFTVSQAVIPEELKVRYRRMITQCQCEKSLVDVESKKTFSYKDEAVLRPHEPAECT